MFVNVLVPVEVPDGYKFLRYGNPEIGGWYRLQMYGTLFQAKTASDCTQDCFCFEKLRRQIDIDLDIPKGWTFVARRIPKMGEFYINYCNGVDCMSVFQTEYRYIVVGPET